MGQESLAIIIDSTIAHARELTKTLRIEDKLEAKRLGLNPDKAVLYTYRKGLYRKTALIDNTVAAMWGVIGTPLGVIGHPYLITGVKINTYSVIKFIRQYKQELFKMRQLFPVLENYVDCSYFGAIRVLKLVGFELSEPFELNGHLFQRYIIE